MARGIVVNFDQYWSAVGKEYVFSVKAKSEKGLEKVYRILLLSSVGIRRHIKIKADANPYLPE